MPSNQYKLPVIKWGSSFANTLNIAYPLDDWRSYSMARAGSVITVVESGESDSWIIGWDFILESTVRWIPTTDTTNPIATGWDGTGWRAFLESAIAQTSFRFFPDKTSSTYITSTLVADNMTSVHELEADGTRSIRLSMRNTSGSYAGF